MVLALPSPKKSDPEAKQDVTPHQYHREPSSALHDDREQSHKLQHAGLNTESIEKVGLGQDSESATLQRHMDTHCFKTSESPTKSYQPTLSLMCDYKKRLVSLSAFTHTFANEL